MPTGMDARIVAAPGSDEHRPSERKDRRMPVYQVHESVPTRKSPSSTLLSWRTIDRLRRFVRDGGATGCLL
ncbi:MAG TPA: hypothetical protein VE442_01045 [Jatrophihabitans sp.]|jgi:hypothetical protein|nr:hypothetical protein [Jatrophihabitans sp.]